MSLKLSDLHELYSSVSREDAVAMANLGAVCWSSFKDGLYSQWATTMTSEEAEKAAVYKEEGRREGREAMLESLKARVAAGEAAISRVATLEASIAEEVERKTGEMLLLQQQKDKLIHQQELESLKIQLAELKGKDSVSYSLKESQSDMKMAITCLNAELAKYKEANSTKSSYALGKIGEVELFEMLTKYVLPKFQFSDLKNMTAVKHVGDFHLWIIGPTMKRIKILIDSKKYSSPVQNIEIEKLYTDVDADEDVDVGLMVSLDTPISTKEQFQITKTKKNKPCMFLSFDKLDDGIRQEVLCWAIRSLVCIASTQERGKRDTMIEEIELFMKDLNASVADLDSCIKTAKNLCDLLRDMKDRLVARIHKCRINSGMETSTEVVTMPEVETDVRCKGVKMNGERCKSLKKAGSDLCGRHAAEQGKNIISE
jgi:hypothetical protein